MAATNNLLALDIGDERVGVAMARADVQVPVVLTTLLRNVDNFWKQLSDIIVNHDIQAIILGLPRGLDGQETAQTRAARDFGAELRSHTQLPMYWQDEAVTSVKAEVALKASGKAYQKADIDGIAATYILADYLESIKAVV